MKNLSLKAKTILMSVGISLVTLGSTFIFSTKLRSASTAATGATEILSEIEKIENAFDRMTIGMRGYILDPSRKDEWQNKKRADQDAVKALTKAIGMTNYPALKDRLTQISEIDEKEMDRLENEFGSLVDARQFEKASRFYLDRYLPSRKKMDEQLHEARAIASEARDQADRSQEQMITQGTWVLLTVIAGSFCAFFFLNQQLANGLSFSLRQLSSKLNSSVMSIELASKNTASASQQIATSATENASAITETLSISESGKKEAERGSGVVNRMTAAMGQVSEANTKLEGLIKVIEDIQSKTKVINDIVFETRLLSFNASIEAARAGSHGKGFAVVAEEVGKLAAVSGKAAEEINALLATSTHQVREIVSTTTQRVDAARESSEQCEQVFSQMSHSMSEINRAMTDMERETHHNSASSEEMANQAQTLAMEARALTGLLNKLNQVVSGRDDQMDNQGGNPLVGTHPDLDSAMGGGTVLPFKTAKQGLQLSPPSATDGASVDRNDTRWKVS